jgi:hypothetical protein
MNQNTIELNKDKININHIFDMLGKLKESVVQNLDTQESITRLIQNEADNKTLLDMYYKLILETLNLKLECKQTRLLEEDLSEVQ